MTDTNMQYDATYDYYWGPTNPADAEFTVVYDNCSNSSIDTSLWDIVLDSGTVTETTYQEVYAARNGGAAKSAYSESKLISFDNNSILNVEIPLISMSTNTFSAWAYAEISFGGVKLIQKSRNCSGTTSLTDLRLQVIKIASKYYYRVYESSTWGAWTIFTPTTTKLKVHTYTNATDTSSSTIRFKDVRYNSLTTPLTGTSYLVSPATSESVLDAISTCNYSVGEEAGSAVEIYLSSDNGVNYELCTDATIHRFTNTGSSLLVKLVLKGAGVISEYAVLYNLGAA
jgi:hypothetical protein